MRTVFYTTIVMILAIFSVVANSNGPIAGIGAISHIEASFPVIWDTIRFEDGTKFTSSRSLLSSFEGYRDLLRNRENFSPISSCRGYRNNWIEKEGKIYMESTSFHSWEDIPPPPEEWQAMLEELTGEKFNEDGLLPANWLTGSFNLLGTVLIPGWFTPYMYTFCAEREYIFHFYQGKLIKIEYTETGLKNEEVLHNLIEQNLRWRERL